MKNKTHTEMQNKKPNIFKFYFSEVVSPFVGRGVGGWLLMFDITFYQQVFSDIVKPPFSSM